MEIIKHNPWLGLTSYTEESLDEYQFNGRSVATAALVSMIENNLFVTLYGRSGIGKTSLLQAGVFPLLRRKGMLPVSIRLNEIRDPKTGKENANYNEKDIQSNDNCAESKQKQTRYRHKNIETDKDKTEADQEDKHIYAAEVIWSAIVSEARNQGYNYVQYSETDIYQPDFSDTLVLRNLFSAGEFINKDGQRTIPLIALDQFEEILYNASTAAGKVILQLYALVDDNYNYAIMHPEWHDDTDFRIVISIREDDLFLLEDTIDTLNCSGFRSNRYRLMPLSDKEAEEVILKPSEEIFNEDEKEKIVNSIIALVRQKGDSINTLALSLMCYVLFEQCYKPGKPISIDNLKGYSDILETYYLEATKGFNKGKKKRQLHYLEEKLIDSQGRRSYIYGSDFEKNAPDAKEFLENSGKKLLNLNQGRVEYIHDQLAAAVSKIRNKRNQKTSRLFGTTLLIIGLIVLFLYSFSQVPDLMSKNSIIKLEGSAISDNTISGNPYVTDIICMPASTYIFDCPNLKSVKITGKDGTLYLFNCPNLVNIIQLEKFSGVIYVYNCPNVKKSNIIKDYEPTHLDSIYASQMPYSVNITNTFSYKIDQMDIDPLKNRVTYKILPFYGSCTGSDSLPDSIKWKFDCYVPFGTKEKFSQLTQFHPYRSLNETPIYDVWDTNFKSVWGYFIQNSLILILSILGIAVMMILLGIISFTKYLRKGNSVLTSFFKALIAGIGIGLVGVLSFMAAYWTSFNIILPDNQEYAIYLGIGMLVICILLIYKNSFFSMWIYFKENGLRGFIRDAQNVFAQTVKKLIYGFGNIFKKNLKKFVIYILIGIAIGVVITFYKLGKSQRLEYIDSLNELVKNDQFGKALSLIPAIEDAHKSFLYPSFTYRLESIKKKLDKDSLYLISRISPNFLNTKVQAQGLHININNFYGNPLAASSNGSKFVIPTVLVKGKDDIIYQTLIFDLVSQTIDTVTAQSSHSSYTHISLSPSNNLVAASNDKGIWLYDLNLKTIQRISDKSSTQGLVFVEDSTLLFSTADDKLIFRIKLMPNGIAKPTSIQSAKDYCNLCRIDSEHIAANENFGQFRIYDIQHNKEIVHGEKAGIGRIQSVDIESGIAITDMGIYDINCDSLTFLNRNVLYYQNQPIIANFEDKHILFKDLKATDIINIPLFENLFEDKIKISNDSYIYYSHPYKLTVYRISPEVEENWPITDADRKLFNLPK